MTSHMKACIRASLVLLGTIIGAGVFAVPIAMQRVGLLTGSIVFWVVALMVLAIHLMYVDVLLAQPSLMKRRLPGQAGIILGRWAERIAFVSHPAQVLGACLAYIILGGEFLSVLAQAVGLPHSVLFWQLIFWIGGAITVFCGLTFVAKIEGVLTWILIALLLIASLGFALHTDGSSLVGTDWSRMLAPFGIFLFALFGLPVITEVAVLCKNDRERTRLAVAIGSFAAAFLTWLFGLFAAAANTGAVGPTDFVHGLPVSWFWVIPAVGFFAVATSFVTMTQDLKATFHVDANLSQGVSWALALCGPLFLLFFVSRDFLRTISLVGLVFGSLNGILVLLMSWKMTQQMRTRRRSFVASTAPLIFCLVFLGVSIWGIISL